MTTIKRTTKKAATKRAAKLEKIGHFNITVYKNEQASVEVDCPTNDILAALSSIITSDEGPGQLIRKAMQLAIVGLEEEQTRKKKKKAAPKKKK
jgi:hypothetical protein